MNHNSPFGGRGDFQLRMAKLFIYDLFLFGSLQSQRIDQICLHQSREEQESNDNCLLINPVMYKNMHLEML